MLDTLYVLVAGISTLSNLVQMAALTAQNFASGAAGVAVAIAGIRSFSRIQFKTLGSFWVDLICATLYLFLPLSLIGALFLCSQGAIRNLHPNTVVKTVEGVTQTIPQGLVASREAIKMVGTDGGGFFNGNSSHPFENPTRESNPLTNFVQMLMQFHRRSNPPRPARRRLPASRMLRSLRGSSGRRPGGHRAPSQPGAQSAH